MYDTLIGETEELLLGAKNKKMRLVFYLYSYRIGSLKLEIH